MRIMLILCAVLLAASPAAAEPGPIGSWLMSEPLTLWDKGMMAMREDAREAAKAVAADKGAAHWISVTYDWEDNEIKVNFSVWGFRGDLSHQHCNQTRRAFIFGLIGYRTDLDEKKVSKERATGQIRTWFSHVGFVRKTRDKDLEQKLARIIFVSTSLRRDAKPFTIPMGPSISCRDRLTVSDAPSRPFAGSERVQE